MPSARIATTVFMQSALRENPRRTQGPLANDAIKTARCEMLLSPETAISASIRGARFIRRSSMFAKRCSGARLARERGEESQLARKCPARRQDGGQSRIGVDP